MLIVNTGVLIAATDLPEPEHDACAALLETETAYLLDRELGPQVEATPAPLPAKYTWPSHRGGVHGPL